MLADELDFVVGVDPHRDSHAVGVIVWGTRLAIPAIVALAWITAVWWQALVITLVGVAYVTVAETRRVRS